MRHDCRGRQLGRHRTLRQRAARLAADVSAAEDGIPSHDTFGRVFALLDPAELVACIQQWLDDVGREIGKHIAIDGKTLRGSFDKAAGRNPLHLVSAWASEARLTLGQIAVDSKSNEITAIPLLLELLDLKGATVTIDAMGCQKEIAAKIVAGGGDYVLALKGNHEKLHEAVDEEFTAALEADVRPARHASARDGGNQPRPPGTPRIHGAAGARVAARLCRLGRPGHPRHGAAHHASRRPGEGRGQLLPLQPAAEGEDAGQAHPPALEHREPACTGCSM